MLELGGRWRIASLLVLLAGSVVRADDLTLHVQQLVEKLNGETLGERDDAEQSLLRLGVSALKLLPASNAANLSSEQQIRLARISQSTILAVRSAELAPSRVQWNQAMPLDELLREVERQSGNPIKDVRATYNQPVTNPTIEPLAAAMDFWPALDEIARRANLSIDHCADRRFIGLISSSPVAPKVVYSGPFRFAIEEVSIQRDFTTEEPENCSISLGISVEPRRLPLLIDLDGPVSTVDETGRLSNTGRLMYAGRPFIPHPNGGVRPSRLQILAPSRGIRTLAKMSAELSVWIPARTLDFAVEKLSGDQPTKWTRDGVRVKVEPVKVVKGSQQLDGDPSAALDGLVFLVV